MPVGIDTIISVTVIVLNIGGIIINARSILKYRKLMDDWESRLEIHEQWEKARRKWINRRKRRVQQVHDAKLAKQYLAELDELQNLLKPLSRKIISPMNSDENVG